MSEADRKKWNARYASAGTVDREASRVLLALDQWIPRRGRALDIAGGCGRHAIWLAQRGLDVTLADVSAVGLAQAVELSSRHGTRFSTLEVDLRESSFPVGPWDFVLSTLYLDRDAWRCAAKELASDGTFIVIHPTHANLERHEKPPRNYLLEVGELSTLLPELETLEYREGWLEDGRHDAVLVARRTGLKTPASIDQSTGSS